MTDDPIADYLAMLERWPNCETADCENKSCTWSTLPDLCFPCGARRLGRDAMIQRFNETHDIPWDEADAY